MSDVIVIWFLLDALALALAPTVTGILCFSLYQSHDKHNLFIAFNPPM